MVIESVHAIQRDPNEAHFEESLCKLLYDRLVSRDPPHRTTNTKLYLFSGFKTPTICRSCFCCLQSFCGCVLGNAEMAFFHVSNEQGNIPTTALGNLDLSTAEAPSKVVLNPLYVGLPTKEGRMLYDRDSEYDEGPAHEYDFQSLEKTKEGAYKYPHLRCCGKPYQLSGSFMSDDSGYLPQSHCWQSAREVVHVTDPPMVIKVETEAEDLFPSNRVNEIDEDNDANITTASYSSSNKTYDSCYNDDSSNGNEGWTSQWYRKARLLFWDSLGGKRYGF